MTATNTRELAEEFEWMSKAIADLMDSLELEAPPAISGRFHNALVSAGMPESESGEYSTALRSAINDVKELAETVRKQLGSAAHIATAGPTRAIRLNPASPYRNLGYLDL
jgi:hypothetical protein